MQAPARCPLRDTGQKQGSESVFVTSGSFTFIGGNLQLEVPPYSSDDPPLRGYSKAIALLQRDTRLKSKDTATSGELVVLHSLQSWRLPSQNTASSTVTKHENTSLPAPTKDFRRSDRDSSLETSTQRRANPRDYAITSGGFGLETLETGHCNVNLALDEITDAGIRRALSSVSDREFGRISVAISQLTERAILARELSQRGSRGGEAFCRGIPDGNKSQRPQPLIRNPERNPATEESVALVFRPRNAPLDSKGKYTKRGDPVREGLRIDSMRTINKGDLVVTVPTEKDSESLRSNKSLTEVFDINSASNSWPKLRITNVDIAFRRNEYFRADVQNSLAEKLGISVEGKLRIRGRVGPRGTPTTSWILEVHPLVRKALRD